MFYVFCMMAIKILTLEDVPHLLYSERTDSLFQSVAKWIWWYRYDPKLYNKATFVCSLVTGGGHSG